MAVSRSKLYDEVWAEPMTTVAKRYEVSSNFLARICERLNIPRPPRGYWAKLSVGKAPAQPPLPDERAGDILEWVRGGEPERAPLALQRVAEVRSRRIRRPPSERPARHPLVVGVREFFEAGRTSDSGYLRPTKRLLVDLFVSKTALERALDLANELFLSFEDRRHRVVLAPRDGRIYARPEVEVRLGGDHGFSHTTWRPERPTVAFIGDLAVGLTLFELSEKIEFQRIGDKDYRLDEVPIVKGSRASTVSWTHERDVPTGRFCLRATSPYLRASWERQWRESKPGEFPGRFPKIVREIEGQAAAIANLVEEGERKAELDRQQLEAMKEQWRREEEERQRLKNIKESREQLFAIIEAWGVAKRIEGFFEDIAHRASDLDDGERALFGDRPCLPVEPAPRCEGRSGRLWNGCSLTRARGQSGLPSQSPTLRRTACAP
jgi:hypothetical protein